MVEVAQASWNCPSSPKLPPNLSAVSYPTAGTAPCSAQHCLTFLDDKQISRSIKKSFAYFPRLDNYGSSLPLSGRLQTVDCRQVNCLHFVCTLQGYRNAAAMWWPSPGQWCPDPNGAHHHYHERADIRSERWSCRAPPQHLFKSTRHRFCPYYRSAIGSYDWYFSPWF